MADGLVWDERPALRDPLLVAAFEGWNDAESAATDAARFLLGDTDLRRIAWIEPDEHVDYQSRRPLVVLSDGVMESVSWPGNECYVVSYPERDLVVLLGVEPNVRWQSFCDTVVTIAQETACSRLVTFGALLGDVPHTRPVRLTGTAADPGLIRRMGLLPSVYAGPTGIVGALHDACTRRELPSVSLWASVPHYLADHANPPATRALLSQLATIADIEFDFSELDARTEEWRVTVDEAIGDDLEDYVRDLEEQVDRGLSEPEPSLDADLPTGDELAEELEQFLRTRDDET